MPAQPKSDMAGLQQLMTQVIRDTIKNVDDKIETGSNRSSHLFPFDPNTLSEEGFRKLGLREKLIKTLIHYREKGGKFYTKESLQRIYGLKENEYQQLLPFIQIGEQKVLPTSNEIPVYSKIDLNTADQQELEKLPGIGAALAGHIIQYRGQLGGFTSIHQLSEVYGISATTFKQIQTRLQVLKPRLQTLNLNTATYYELNAHPYLHGEIAGALVEYRKAHHYKIEKLEQIREIALINDEIFRKIVPYLRI